MPKPTRRELKSRIAELETKLKADLDSCNKEWREIFERAQARVEELEKEVAPYRVKEGRFYYQTGTSSPGFYVCGFCTWRALTSDEMKKHIRENH